MKAESIRVALRASFFILLALLALALVSLYRGGSDTRKRDERNRAEGLYHRELSRSFHALSAAALPLRRGLRPADVATLIRAADSTLAVTGDADTLRAGRVAFRFEADSLVAVTPVFDPRWTRGVTP